MSLGTRRYEEDWVACPRAQRQFNDVGNFSVAELAAKSGRVGARNSAVKRMKIGNCKDSEKGTAGSRSGFQEIAGEEVSSKERCEKKCV